MTCICKTPKPTLMRGRDRKYQVICMSCLRAGYKAKCKTAANFYWELATEPEKWTDKEQPYPVPAGIVDHPFLYEAIEENET